MSENKNTIETQQIATKDAPEIATKDAPAAETSVKLLPMQYLDKAMGALRGLGLMPDHAPEVPIIALLQQISDLDETRITMITRTLSQMSVFNDVVREQIEAMNIGQRYETITKAFNSIRDDAKKMVNQLEDGRIDTFERIENVWTKITRGDVASRFDKIRNTYLEVAKDTKEQIAREHIILESYRDFRGALKESEIMALEVLKTAGERLDAAKESLGAATKVVNDHVGDEPAKRARFELKRDEQLRFMQNEEKLYQIAKDLSDNLTIGYNTSEVVMARLMQTTSVKERVYAQSISFFSTNEVVLTALKSSFAGLHGLHESTASLNAMKDGVSMSLETLATIGGKVQEEGLKAGYGATVRADSVKMLVDSVINFQERSHEIIAEMRTQATRNSQEIRDAVEDGKKRLARLAARGGELSG